MSGHIPLMAIISAAAAYGAAGSIKPFGGEFRLISRVNQGFGQGLTMVGE
jgi:hypothetical protein